MQRLVGCAARRSLAGFMSTSSLAKKRQKTSVMAASNTKTIGTHSGTFHCDEALGCFLLHQTKEFAGADVVRTRDPELLKTLDVIIDVGGEYDAANNRFDHHQKGFEEVFGSGFDKIKLSSAGLVYKHFGREIVESVMGADSAKEDVEAVYLHVYKSFMQCIDAVDNGVNQYDTTSPPLYTNNTHLSARVGNLNPDWYETTGDEELMARFKSAMALTGSEFMEALHYAIKSWLPARSYVLKDLKDRTVVDPSGQIMKLSSFVPWKSHVYELEAELGIQGDEMNVKYVVYEDERDGSWRIQAVGMAPGSFTSRKPLPEAWRGLRDGALSEACGVPDCVFVHASGFIGGNKRMDGALEMARKALAM